MFSIYNPIYIKRLVFFGSYTARLLIFQILIFFRRSNEGVTILFIPRISHVWLFIIPASCRPAFINTLSHSSFLSLLRKGLVFESISGTVRPFDGSPLPIFFFRKTIWFSSLINVRLFLKYWLTSSGRSHILICFCRMVWSGLVCAGLFCVRASRSIPSVLL